MNTVDSRGVLHGVRVVEMAGLGPVSFTGMLLAKVGTLRVRTKAVLALQPSLVFGRMTDLQARTAFVELAGELQPAPAPRFAATPSRTCARRPGRCWRHGAPVPLDLPSGNGQRPIRSDSHQPP